MKPKIYTEDAAALRQTESIPFAALVKTILAIGIKKPQYGMNMAFFIRLSKRQLSKIYRQLPPISHCLHLRSRPTSLALISFVPTVAQRWIVPPNSAPIVG